MKTTLVPDDAGAVALGFEPFNRNPHLCVDLPDGSSTITVRTADGRRVTFAFLAYGAGAPPKALDVVYHDGGRGRRDLPAFDALVMAGGLTPYTSRKARADLRPTCVCVLLEPMSIPGAGVE